MAMVHLPDDLARRLEAEAARRGVSVDAVAVETLEGRFGPTSINSSEALDAFVGTFESGDPEWAGTDTRALRADAAARRAR